MTVTNKIEYDFSKEEDQERFLNLPGEIKNKLIERAHEEANQINNLISSGKARNFDEAVKMIPEFDISKYDFTINISENGDVYLNLGGGKTLIGNYFENAISETAEGTFLDIDKVDENMEKILRQIDLLIGKPYGNA